jgi:two-component system chemotaxis response regulator CheY
MGNLFSNKSVLIVDDSSTVRQILINGLKQIGFEGSMLKAVGDGKFALDKLKDTEFNLIISDWDMPRMNGIELLKEVKSNSGLKNIPFLMVTAKNEKQNIEKAFESGADQFISKPFSPEDLERLVSQLLTHQNHFNGKRVLVVDDSQPMRKIIIKNLIQAGFQTNMIKEAGDGRDAIKMLAEENYDLVMTDWHMPEVDGLELINMIRSAESKYIKKIPVLMVTSETEKEKIIEAIQMGAGQYIIKPFNSVQLQDKIRQIIS